MRYIYCQTGDHDFIILVQLYGNHYEYFAQCRLKSVADKLVNALNAAEAE